MLRVEEATLTTDDDGHIVLGGVRPTDPLEQHLHDNLYLYLRSV